jgi:purine-binding chemotaxis protein CheW
MSSLVAVSLNEQHYALHLPCVERVVRAAEITPLPGAPSIVAGVIDVAGSVIPVIDLRKRLGLLEREIVLSDQLVIARTTTRTVALIVDAVTEVMDCSQAQISSADAVLPGLRHVSGVASLPTGLLLIQDLERLLSLDEERALDAAISGGSPEPE